MPQRNQKWPAECDRPGRSNVENPPPPRFHAGPAIIPHAEFGDARTPEFSACPSASAQFFFSRADCARHPRCAADEARPDPLPGSFTTTAQKKLHANKLPDAESLLQGAVASQDLEVQIPGLYNLGELRFLQGQEQAQEGPDPAGQRCCNQKGR